MAVVPWKEGEGEDTRRGAHERERTHDGCGGAGRELRRDGRELPVEHSGRCACVDLEHGRDPMAFFNLSGGPDCFFKFAGTLTYGP